MEANCAKWPSRVMKGKWKVGEWLRDPAVIVLEATGQSFVSIECDCDIDEIKAREIAQHIVDLHNSQLRK